MEFPVEDARLAEREASARQDEVLDRAISLFRKQGYHRTTMKDLADAIGMQKGSIYYHFPSKEVILTNAIEKLAQVFKTECLAIAYSEHKTAQERLVDMLNYIRDNGEAVGANFMVQLALEELAEFPSVKALIASYFRAWREAFEHVFMQKYGAGRAPAVAEDTVAYLEGVLVMQSIHPDHTALARCCRFVGELL
jgi:TetR/AcrR family transcriptional repressor of nem operon